MSLGISSDLNTNYKQCSRCVMDTSDTEIVFDDEIFCNHCNSHLLQMEKIKNGKDTVNAQLKRKILEIKESGKNNKYDCIVGVSGGADGCYSAYLCKQYGLRALLVHMDNGWNSTIAVENIKVVADKLQFDYESFVLDWVEFKDLQLSFLKASVPEIETPTDIAILGSLHKLANKCGIKHIIMGCNYYTEGILPKSWHYDAKDKKYVKSIHSIFGKEKLKNFPFFDFWTEAYNKFIKRTTIFYLLNYVNYDRKKAIEILKELGWKDYLEKHHESHFTKLVQTYILPLKFNIDYRKVFLSASICNGEITREDALKTLKYPYYNESKVEGEIEYVCKKLGISTLEFSRIMSSPTKSYKDYPNNKRITSIIYKIYLFLTNKPEVIKD
jgi:N-acetyl sugar amidotransferase